MNKKGVSPLIATVLIIGFTIALAAVVMTWGGGFVRSTTESTEASADLTLKCSTQVVFDVKNAVDNGDNTGIVTIENKGDLEITSLMLRTYDVDGTPIGTLDTKGKTPEGVQAFGVETFDLTATEMTNAVEVEALARISDNKGGEYTCGQTPRSRDFSV